MENFTPSRGRGKTLAPRRETRVDTEKEETAVFESVRSGRKTAPLENQLTEISAFSPKAHTSKARSVISNHSNASMLRNKARTIRETTKLEDFIGTVEVEVGKIQDSIESQEKEMEFNEQRNKPELAEENRKRLCDLKLQEKHKIRELKELKKSFERRKELLATEEEAANEEMRENLTSEEEDEDREETILHRTTEWAETQKTDLEVSNEFQEVHDYRLRSPESRHGVPSDAGPNSLNPYPYQSQDGLQQLAIALHHLSTGPKYSQEDVELPKFDGKPEDWPIFIENFERINKMIKPSQMLSKLRNSLKGSAYDFVKQLLTKSINIPKIMKRLEERYGQPKFVLEALIEKARSAPSPSKERPETMIEFGVAVTDLVDSIESYQENSYLAAPGLLRSLTAKLPTEYDNEWIEWVLMDSSRQENLETFAKWIDIKMRVAYRRSSSLGNQEHKEERSKRIRHVGAIYEEEGTSSSRAASPEKSTIRKYSCSFCHKENHKIQECQRFISLSTEERIKIVKDLGLCFSCLFWGHRTFRCRKKTICGINNCALNHHPLIHDEDKKDLQESADKNPEDGAKTENHIGHVRNLDPGAPFCYLPVKVREGEGKQEYSVYAMFDGGSSDHFMDDQLTSQMGIAGLKEERDYTFLGGIPDKKMIQEVKLQIASDAPGAKFYDLHSVKSMENLNLPAQTLNMEEEMKQFPYLKGAPLKSQKNVRPLILLGKDFSNFMTARITIRGTKETDPIAVKTSLGWFLTKYKAGSGNSKEILYVGQRSKENLEQLFKDFICLDNFGVNEFPSVRSKEDNRALEIMENTTKRVEGRWETGLLWRDNIGNIPESRLAAMNRLQSLERKMDSNKEFAELCVGRFQEYIDKGYLKKITEEAEIDYAPERITGKVREWYLPHFFVYHPDKKPRLVFDAAAKSNKKCFNDFFYTGPDNLRQLPVVLMKFRKHFIGLTGDVTAMFHQVSLRKEDQPMQKILYRGMNRRDPPDEYVMTSLFFGSVCSPSSAIYVKDRNAKEFENKYPVAVKRIMEETYMDDFLSGADSKEDVLKLQQQVTWVHKQGGFPITKWSCSALSVMNQIPEELRANSSRKLQTKEHSGMEKTLGLLWNPEGDYFTFKFNPSKLAKEVMAGKRTPTKREVASCVMSLFDPLGFLTPLKIQGLRIFQETWRRRKDEEVLKWNDTIPEILGARWMAWFKNLEKTLANNEVQIPRCIRRSVNDKSTYQLHTFVDASQEAYSAAVYLRIETGENIEVSFLSGKGRVAPIKGLTVPRMELNAALIGARLSSTVHKAYNEEILFANTYYWTDSRTVMSWINSESGRFSQYVANRIGEICVLSEPQQWRWVPTKDNAADDATRSNSDCKFNSDCRWLKGSDFLQKNESEWPRQEIPAAKTRDLEERLDILLAVSKKRLPLPDPSNYSAWWPLIRKTALLITAFNEIRGLNKKRENIVLTLEGIEAAERIWCKQVQIDSFSDEYKRLKKGLPVDKRSRLYKLSPTLKCGLIVLQGRINRAPHVSDSIKNPIILDQHHPYTKLLIKRHHIVNAHQGQETVVNNIRKKYHVLDCRTAVKSAIERCGTCRLLRAKPAEQLMGEIPEARVAVGELPFTHTGVDLFGPLEVTIGRRREKRWGVLFTCLTTRAVHLDVVPSCSTSDFMDCLIRFNARRGPVKHLYSDNATNFHGANNEIQKCMKQWNHKRINEDLMRGSTSFSTGPEWHFNAPASPHMGGSWERLIGLTKKILISLMKERTPKEYSLLTVFAEIENILNSRPLSITSPDPKDPECLTPNHILKLRVAPSKLVPGEYTDKIPRKMWRYVQKVVEDFWERWTQECLPLLLPRKKWFTDQPAIREGDIVFLLDNLALRSDWKKGVVDKTFPGRDGKIRVVDIRVPVIEKGKFRKFVTFRRHLTKICPLGINVSDKTLSYGRENVKDNVNKYGLAKNTDYSQRSSKPRSEI